MSDHYELQCAMWAKQISRLDPVKLRHKLPELHGKPPILTLWHFDRHIIIDFRTGKLHSLSM